MEYRDGFIFPDSFFKKYTKFNNYEDFSKTAKKYGVKLLKTIYGVEIKSKQTLTPNLFFEQFTSFKNIDELIQKGSQEYKNKPIVLPKMFLKNKSLGANYISPISTKYWCLYCGKEGEIKKGEIIPECSCGKTNLYLKKPPITLNVVLEKLKK